MALINVSLLDGRPGDLYSLFEWLQRVDEFRGRVRTLPRQPGPHEMGEVANILSVALGSGGAGAVLAGSLATWLQTRRARISVELVTSETGETTRKVEVDARNAVEVSELYGLLAPRTGRCHEREVAGSPNVAGIAHWGVTVHQRRSA